MHLRVQMFQTDVIGQCKCSKRTLLAKNAPLGPFVTIRNVHFSYIFAFRSAHVERNDVFVCRNAIRGLPVNRFRSTYAERNAPLVLIHKHLICAQNRSRSTLVDRIVFLIRSNICSLCVHVLSRSTPVDPNACPIRSYVLSLDACRSKCVSYVLRCVLARRLSIQMRFLHARMCSRSCTSDGYLSKHEFYDSRALIFLSVFVFKERWILSFFFQICIWSFSCAVLSWVPQIQSFQMCIWDEFFSMCKFYDSIYDIFLSTSVFTEWRFLSFFIRIYIWPLPHAESSAGRLSSVRISAPASCLELREDFAWSVKARGG